MKVTVTHWKKLPGGMNIDSDTPTAYSVQFEPSDIRLLTTMFAIGGYCAAGSEADPKNLVGHAAGIGEMLRQMFKP